jgi:hypothetical protein
MKRIVLFCLWVVLQVLIGGTVLWLWRVDIGGFRWCLGWLVLWLGSGIYWGLETRSQS